MVCHSCQRGIFGRFAPRWRAESGRKRVTRRRKIRYRRPVRRVSFASRMRIGGAAAVPIAVGILLSVLVLVGERQLGAHRGADSRCARASPTTVTQIAHRGPDRADCGGRQQRRDPRSPCPPRELAQLAACRSTRPSRRATPAPPSSTTLRRPAAIVVPVYERARRRTYDRSSAARTSSRTAACRCSWSATVAQLADRPGGLVVRGPDAVVAAAPGAAPAGASTFGVDMDLADSPGWRVEAWRPDPGYAGSDVVLDRSASWRSRSRRGAGVGAARPA